MDWCPATGTRMKSLFQRCVCCFFTLALTRSAGLGCLTWMSFKVPSPQTLLGFQERSGAGAGAVTAPGNLGAPNCSSVPNPAAKTSAQPVPKPCFPSPSLLPAPLTPGFPKAAPLVFAGSRGRTRRGWEAPDSPEGLQRARLKPRAVIYPGQSHFAVGKCG